MDVGREVVTLLERIAVANEKLIELATEERAEQDAPGPPFCPHCQTVNPTVSSEGGSGSMREFILGARCGNCGKQFFAVPEGWVIFNNPEAALAVLGGGNE